MKHRQETLHESSIEVDILINQVTKLISRKKRNILDEFGLTCSQFEILSAIYHFSKSKKEIIQIDLSEISQIDPMTTSTILRNLQKKGLVTRVRSLENARAIIVKLTGKGSDTYEKAFTKVSSASKSIYQDIDKNEFASQLSIIYNHLNKSNN